MSYKIIQSAKNWQGFVDALDPLNKKQQGNAFELLTELFLKIDPIYRSKLKEVWHESDIPPNIRHKLGLPSPEIGVDLVAQTKSGEYWAIQCKYHTDPHRNLTLNELDPFINTAVVKCKGKFSTLLAVSSANGYSINLRKHYPNIQYCLSDTFQMLDEGFSREARRTIRNLTPKIDKRDPRDHQRKAIRKAVKHFVKEGEARGKLIHPCGTGKSLIGYWIADKLKGKTVLVALPSLYLVRQTLADWTKESLALKKPMDWMVVCSEDTIGESGDPAMRFQEIGVDVTTNVDDIARFLRRRSGGQKVIFTTYQSGVVTAKAAKKANRIFDVGIFDEAHRTVGQADSLFAHLISEKNVRIRKRVFMTATERRYQGSSDTILSMDDVDAYGDTFDKMTFKEALEAPKPILSDYKIVTMVIGRSEIQHLIDENFLVKPDKGKWDDDTEARALAALIALRKTMKRYRANHALTFHNSIAKAEAFKKSQERFNGVVKGFGNVDCYHVSSKVSTGERKQELERFRHSKKALITNAKCLTEGVDVPTIDAVLFADIKRSTVDIVQAAGRALRTAEGKKMGYIIVPALVDEDDPEAADKAFQDILMTLRGMASNDDRIIDYFRSVSQGKRPTKSDSLIDFVVPDPIRIKLADFVQNVETQSWHRLAKLSWMPFEEAREFVHALNLNTQEDWSEYCQGQMEGMPPLPADIPMNPRGVYEGKGWISMGDWLGTGRVANQDREWRPFIQSREFAHSLHLMSRREWNSYCAGEMPDKPTLPIDIPKTPRTAYLKEGWVTWGDWLGTGIVSTRDLKWRPFEQARAFAHGLKLKSSAEWYLFCKGKIPGKPKKPDDIPVKPNRVYAGKGWISFGDWLGTGRVADQYKTWQPFKEARAFAQSLKLSGANQWGRYCKGEIPGLKPKPVDIPSNPNKIYKDAGWVSWGDWLGTGHVHSPDYRPFKKAREFARSLKLKTVAEWRLYVSGKMPKLLSLPDDIPAEPYSQYLGKGWISWPDWLGTARWSFEAARAFARKLKLGSRRDWEDYCSGKYPELPERPPGIPAAPWSTYKGKGWISTSDWLGIK